MTALEALNTIYADSLTNPNTSKFLEIAELRTSPTQFGDKRFYAVALRAAHMMVLDTRAGSAQGAAGAISGMTESKLSVQYAGNPNIKNADLAQTSFGVELDGMIKGNVITIDVAGRTDQGVGIGDGCPPYGGFFVP